MIDWLILKIIRLGRLVRLRQGGNNGSHSYIFSLFKINAL
jgi:hypothetical protein